MTDCDGTCPDGRYCAEHGDLFPDDKPTVPFRSSIGVLQAAAWLTAEEHGFHKDSTTFGDRIALVHSELSEALEEYRALGEAAFEYRVEYSTETDTLKPEGVGAELADAIIRIFDLAQHYGIDLEHIVALKMEYNRKRPFMHGGKTI